MNTTIKKLSNGLSVLFTNTHAFPSVTIMVLVGAGSRYETQKNNGIAHFLEHMTFKGSKKYPTSFDISSTIEGLGATFNAFTSKDHTGYYVKAPIAHFDEVVDVLSDMLLHSKLDPAEIEREKGVIVEEINMYEDMPARKVSDLFDEAFFAGHPLSYDIAGTGETVRSFDQSTFKDYMSELYHPENAIVVVAGGLKTSDRAVKSFMATIEEKFGGWKSGKTTRAVPYVSTQKKPIIKVQYKKTEQAHFALGYPAFSFTDPRRHALAVLSAILGGGMSSRLFIEVRERRGLCYYISTGRDLYADTGSIVTQAGVTNNVDQLNKAIHVVRDEHMKLADGGVTDAEVHKAKEMLKGRLLLSLEDSYHVASLQGTRYLFTHEVAGPQEVMRNIDAVTADQITRLAKELFVNSRVTIAVIGPYRRRDVMLK